MKSRTNENNFNKTNEPLGVRTGKNRKKTCLCDVLMFYRYIEIQTSWSRTVRRELLADHEFEPRQGHNFFKKIGY